MLRRISRRLPKRIGAVLGLLYRRLPPLLLAPLHLSAPAGSGSQERSIPSPRRRDRHTGRRTIKQRQKRCVQQSARRRREWLQRKQEFCALVSSLYHW